MNKSWVKSDEEWFTFNWRSILKSVISIWQVSSKSNRLTHMSKYQLILFHTPWKFNSLRPVRPNWTGISSKWKRSPPFTNGSGGTLPPSWGWSHEANWDQIASDSVLLVVTFLFFLSSQGHPLPPWKYRFSLSTASVFAENMGFPAEDLTTNKSVNMFSQWLRSNCQPNYRKVCVCVCVCSPHWFGGATGGRATFKRLIFGWKFDRHSKVVHKKSAFVVKVVPFSDGLLQSWKK